MPHVTPKGQRLRELSPVQQQVAREIVSLVRRTGRRSGASLTETTLAGQLGTSRSPVRAALLHLAEHGVLDRHSNHGFVLTKDAAEWTALAELFTANDGDPLYARIADERQRQLLPEVVNEAELMRRYGVVRSSLRKVLARIAEEGWIEQRVGRGWCFLPMIDSPGAFEESRRYRQAIEPSGLLSPSFRFDAREMAELRQEQQRIAGGKGEDMTAAEEFEANRRFHETLARWSGNRFVVHSLRYVGSLHRLVERHEGLQAGERTKGAREHLAILDAVEAGDMVSAASLLRRHLDSGSRPPAKGGRVSR